MELKCEDAEKLEKPKEKKEALTKVNAANSQRQLASDAFNRHLYNPLFRIRFSRFTSQFIQRDNVRTT